MSTVLTPMATPWELPLFRLSVEQYHDMARKGILKDGDPIELLEGILVKKMTKHSPHSFATQHLRDVLHLILPAGWFVNDQEPITTEDSEPEPDLAIFRGERRDYLVHQRHPGPEDTSLVIEVADSTLHTDQTTKHRIYARANIPSYWIINIPNQRVQVYSGPTGPGNAPTYQQRQDFVPGQEIPVLIAGQEVGRVTVAELFL